MNILLVDDEIVAINILAKTIDWKSVGIDQVFTAYNAFEARKIIDRNPIDLIICDIEMPLENGLHLLEWVRTKRPHILNIILTGYPDFNYAQSAISIGVYKFLLKPVIFSDLIEVVREAVAKIEKDTVKEKYRQYGEYLVNRIDSEELIQEQMNSMVNRLRDSDAKNTKEGTAVNIVKNYLEQHYNESISRKDIESLVHLNEDYLNRIYKKATGYSLLEYIQYFRITMSKQMLTDSNISISEIAARMGYDSPAYFSKVFKKFTGVTPLEYRNDKHT